MHGESHECESPQVYPQPGDDRRVVIQISVSPIPSRPCSGEGESGLRLRRASFEFQLRKRNTETADLLCVVHLQEVAQELALQGHR
jgi:hypothetical protein